MPTRKQCGLEIRGCHPTLFRWVIFPPVLVPVTAKSMVLANKHGVSPILIMTIFFNAISCEDNVFEKKPPSCSARVLEKQAVMHLIKL